MKFGKVLQHTETYFPEKRFLCYKKLKKLLKSTATVSTSNASATTQNDTSPEGIGQSVDRRAFVKLLNQELRALNAYFIGEEENMVIRLQALESALEAAKAEERHRYGTSLVEFHGDVVSLLHWGILNYAAIAKILKKHDKLVIGHPIRQAYLESVVHQPFYSTELLERLCKQCEALLEDLSPVEALRDAFPAILTEAVVQEASELRGIKKTLYAIRTWRDLGDNAHTPSTVLPYSEPLPEGIQQLEQRVQSLAAVQRKRRSPDDDDEKASPAKIARHTK